MKKHILIAVIIAVFTNICTAQELKDKVYYDEDWNIVADASKATYYRLYNANDQSTVKPYKDYWLNGKLRGEGFYSRIDKTNGIDFINQGERKVYFENGNIECSLTYEDGNIEGKATYYYSTGNIDCILNFKNHKFDGRQVKYSPDTENEIWKEDFFDKGLMEKEIRYENGNIRETFTLINRSENAFVANNTWYVREDEDSLLSKISGDYLYTFDPDIWYYPFQLYYVDEADNNGDISQRHGKYQRYDRQGRITRDGHYNYGSKSGIWKVYNYKQNVYMVKDHDDRESTIQYFTFDNQPFSGQWDDRLIDSKVGSIGQCKNGLMDGYWVWYDDFGRKTMEYNYKDGIKHGKGVTNYYDNDGELYFVWEANYIDGNIDGLKEGKGIIDGEWETICFYTYNHGLLEGEFQDYSDSLFIKGHFKDDELDGYYQAYCNDAYDNNYIVREGNYKNGERVGEWIYRYPDDNFYEIQYCDHSAPDRFYSYYDDAPYTGTVVRYFKNGKEKQIYTIKKSFIQQIDVYDAQTGKQTNVIKFKNGLPVYK